MKKILVLLTSNIIVRNYLNNDNFLLLEKQFEVFYGITNVDKKSDSLQKIKKNRKFFYKNTQNSQNLTEKLTSLFLWKNLEKSSTFKYRYLRKLGAHAFFSKRQNIIIKLLRFLKFSIYTNKCWYLLLPLLASKIFFKFFFNYFHNKISFSADLLEFLKTENLDMIIIPSHFFEIEIASIDKVRNNLKSKFLVLINNWDNLSSKGTYWHHPDYLCVWGEQAKEHAIKIQGFKENSVKILGSPIYDKYFSIRNKDLKSFFNFKYVLFTGCNLPFDEINILKYLDNLFCNNPILNTIKIVYRPHPFREKRDCYDIFNEEQFTNVILDPQIKDIYYKKNNQNIENLSLDYYPSLIKNSLFIIAPLSTMLLESLIFYKKVLILSHNDNYHFTTPHRNLKYFENLKPIKNSNLVYFSYNKYDLKNKLSQIINEKQINYKEYDDLVHYILHFDNLDYKMRLLKYVEKII